MIVCLHEGINCNYGQSKRFNDEAAKEYNILWALKMIAHLLTEYKNSHRNPIRELSPAMVPYQKRKRS